MGYFFLGSGILGSVKSGMCRRGNVVAPEKEQKVSDAADQNTSMKR